MMAVDIVIPFDHNENLGDNYSTNDVFCFDFFCLFLVRYEETHRNNPVAANKKKRTTTGLKPLSSTPTGCMKSGSTCVCSVFFSS